MGNEAEESVHVESRNGFAGVFTSKKYLPGEHVLSFNGRVTAEGSRYSIQIDVDRHLDPHLSTNGGPTWKFLNHSCDPNLTIDLEAECFVARREIAEHAELTFNYLTTEWEMAFPFDCICGSSSCLGTIRGFKHLSRDDQERLLPAVSPHIRHLHHRTGMAESERW